VKTLKEELNLVIAGHVDHGKSTVIGRLLADTNSLPKGKLEAVRENCRRNARPFEYAFLLDALKDEQSQGITIDVARCFFKTHKRNYLIIDAPGHIEFLKNMVTGASWAEAALLVIDAFEGVQENSRRHGFMLSFLGIRQICVLVNKMDQVQYAQAAYERIVQEYQVFLDKLEIKPVGFIPVSARDGDNIALRSKNMPWYAGLTVLEQLDAFQPQTPAENKPLRMPVQDVYKFTANDDNRRIVAGQIETGSLSVGDEVVFYPSGKTSTIKSIEAFNREGVISSLGAGHAAGITLTEQVYVRRGEIVTRKGDTKPCTTTRLLASLFWLGKQPLVRGKKYLFKLGTIKVEMEIEVVTRVLDASSLELKEADRVNRNDVAECIIKLERIAAFDPAAGMPETGRFVIVDDYEIAGGGMVIEALKDQQSQVRTQAQERNTRWEKPSISDEERAERYNQKSCLILVTGSPDDSLRKNIARQLEQKLFHEGKFIYYIGMANLLYGIDADIRTSGEEVHPEYFRRLAEVANLMLDAGLILIVTARNISAEDLQILETDLTDRADSIVTVWAGENITTSLNPKIHIRAGDAADAGERIKRYLQASGYIFKYTPNGRSNGY
jgi:bifunctional enzyme CysN/CysC